LIVFTKYNNNRLVTNLLIERFLAAASGLKLIDLSGYATSLIMILERFTN